MPVGCLGETIQKQLGTKNLGEVGKKGGEMWRALSAAAKQPFETKAKEQKDAFEKFKASAPVSPPQVDSSKGPPRKTGKFFAFSFLIFFGP